MVLVLVLGAEYDMFVLVAGLLGIFKCFYALNQFFFA